MTQNNVNQPYQATKGDIIGGTGSGGRPAILPVGTNGQVLVADSSQTTGLKWANTPASGGVVQFQFTQTAATTNGTTFFPVQGAGSALTNAGGTQVFSLSITPKSSSNLLRLQFNIWIGCFSTFPAAGLFQDATVNALYAAAAVSQGDVEGICLLTMDYIMTAGTTSSTTFKVNVGEQAMGGRWALNSYDNGSSAGQIYANTFSSFTITEYAV